MIAIAMIERNWRFLAGYQLENNAMGIIRSLQNEDEMIAVVDGIGVPGKRPAISVIPSSLIRFRREVFTRPRFPTQFASGAIVNETFAQKFN